MGETTAETKPHRWSVLAVDDAPKNLALVVGSLQPHGFDVATAASAPEAMRRMRVDPPDLVLLDTAMPAEAGLALCSKLRMDPELSAIPIIVMSALDTTFSRWLARQAGATDYIEKPIDTALLVARVRKAISDRHRSDQQAPSVAPRSPQADRGGPSRVESNIEAALDSLGEGIIIVDEEDRVIEANPAAQSLLGLPRDSGSRVHLPSFVEDNWRAEHGEVGRSGDALLVAAHDRATTAIEWSARMLRADQAGAWSAVVREATDWWLRDRAVGRVMRSLGHKLRTPLTGLSVGLTLARETESESDRVELLATAEQSANRLRDTIVRILEFIDVIGADLDMGLEVTRLTPEQLRSRLDFGTDVQVENSVHRETEVDIGVARRALGELVRNARKAGATDTKILVMPQPNETIRFEVIDNGRGLPAASAQRAFEPFFQVDRSGEEAGTGLGLAILKALIAKVGGDIGIGSSSDERTVFWFRLPDHSPDPTGV